MLQQFCLTRNVSETYMPPLVQNLKLLLICTRHYKFRTLYKAELNINQIRVKDYIIIYKWQKS